MSDQLDLAVQDTLAQLLAGGHGSHRHLDEALGAVGPPPGDARWVDVARRFAEAARSKNGRFIVSVPLGRSVQLPLAFTVEGIAQISADEPPAIHLVAGHEAQRTWAGEFYRRDLPESSGRLLTYLSAFRDLDELGAGAAFSLSLYFETRV